MGRRSENFRSRHHALACIVVLISDNPWSSMPQELEEFRPILQDLFGRISTTTGREEESKTPIWVYSVLFSKRSRNDPDSEEPLKIRRDSVLILNDYGHCFSEHSWNVSEILGCSSLPFPPFQNEEELLHLHKTGTLAMNKIELQLVYDGRLGRVASGKRENVRRGKLAEPHRSRSLATAIGTVCLG